MQQPPPQSLIGPASQPSRQSSTQVQQPTIAVTEADRIAWMRRFLAALELWRKCLDSAAPSGSRLQAGSARSPDEVLAQNAKADPPWKRQRVEASTGGAEEEKAIRREVTEVS
ncbi:unnamed protein product [Symbiodinium sp. CCMP2456]|nr:unnamed protein product [Symbiodinium sp. CCMP2456]